MAYRHLTHAATRGMCMACVMPPSYPAPTYRMRGCFTFPTAQRPGTLGIPIRAVVHADGRYARYWPRYWRYSSSNAWRSTCRSGVRSAQAPTPPHMPMPWDPASNVPRRACYASPTLPRHGLKYRPTAPPTTPASIPRSSQAKLSPPCTSGCRLTIEACPRRRSACSPHVPATSMRRDREPCA